MRQRILIALSSLLALLLVAGPAAAQSDTTTVTLIHGFRGLLADVYLDGERILQGFAPQRSTDPTELPAGEHLVEVRQADADPDSEPVVEGAVDLPPGANLSAIVHPDADGDPTISVFENAFERAGEGRARAVVRHAAEAPPVDVKVGDADVASDLEPGAEADAVIAPGTSEVTAVDAASSDPLLAPSQVNAEAGTTVALYLIGSAADDSIGWLSQRLDGAGGTSPVGVPTGDTGLVAPVGLPWWAIAAAALSALALLRLVGVAARLRRAGRA